MIDNYPIYPIYIPSKSRADSRLTVRALQAMGIDDFIVVVEYEQFALYNDVLPSRNLVILDKQYQRDYEVCDDLGMSKPVGPGAARNFAMDHALHHGHNRCWIFDDNIEDFYRYNNDVRTRCRSAGLLRSCEVFVDRYENIPLSGLQYRFFCIPGQYRPPFVMNTRIYSASLHDVTAPYRQKGRYNEDTDISLRILKAGDCTIQFNHALQGKMVTQAVRGGNSEAFYDKEGTAPKSDMLERMHPDVAKKVWKYGRWHHEVNYRPYRYNALRPVEHASWERERPHEYGMHKIRLSVEDHKSEMKVKSNAIKQLEQGEL
jgi:hypothetical protein